MHKLNAGMTECSITCRYTGQPSAATLKSKHNRRLWWSARMPKLPGAAPGQQLQSRGGERCSSLSVYEPSSYQAVLVRATVHSQPTVQRLRPSPQPAASPDSAPVHRQRPFHRLHPSHPRQTHWTTTLRAHSRTPFEASAEHHSQASATTRSCSDLEAVAFSGQFG